MRWWWEIYLKKTGKIFINLLARDFVRGWWDGWDGGERREGGRGEGERGRRGCLLRGEALLLSISLRLARGEWGGG